MDSSNLRETNSSPGLPMISSEEKELAGLASVSFKLGNYTLCVEQLKKLASTRKGDPKVDHNLAVAKFYQSGCTNTDELRENLAHASKLAHISLDELELLEDVEHGVFFFNHAVILFHLHQYKDTVRILEKLFQILEPLVETLAHKVLLLLVETYLRTRQSDRALFYLTYLEKVLLGNEPSAKQGHGSDQQSGRETNSSAENTTSEKYEMHKPILNKCKTRCFLQLRSMKACKRELKYMMSSAGSTATTLFMKGNFEYLRQNYRKAIKLLNSAPQSSNFNVTGECVSSMYFNNLSCVHFYMRKYNLGVFYARRSLQENINAVQEMPKQQGRELSGRPLNTIGISRHFELLYNLGIHLLHAGHALSGFDCLVEAVQIYPSNPRLWLRIAECCIASYQDSEASIDGTSEHQVNEDKRGIVEKVVGAGIYRKVVLIQGSTGKKYSPGSGQSAAVPVATLDFARLCLCNALNLLQCEWQTSVTPFSKTTSSSDTDSTDTHSSSKQQGVYAAKGAPPSHPLRRYEVASLRCSIQACSAYVMLGLGDYTCALEHAENLLNEPLLSGSLRFLGHMYAAEALINLDEIADAIHHLSIDNLTDVKLQYPATRDQAVNDREKTDNSTDSEPTEHHTITNQTYPSSMQSAEATLTFNLATAYCIRGEMDKAKRCIMQACSMIPQSDVPPQALLLGIIIELQCGSTQRALQMVKKQQLIPYFKAMDFKNLDPTIILPPANTSLKTLGMPAAQVQSQRPIGTPGQGGFRPIGPPVSQAVGQPIGQSFGLPLGQSTSQFGQPLSSIGQPSPLLGSVPVSGSVLGNPSQGNLFAPGQVASIFSPVGDTKHTWKDPWKQ